MVDKIKKSEWQIVAGTVRGASHLRSGLPNQDALYWISESGQDLPITLAVADGHGSAKSFRSDQGSILAVKVTAKIIHDFVRSQTLTTNLSVIKRAAEERLPQDIVRQWKKVVSESTLMNPFTAEEIDTLVRKNGAAACRKIEANQLIAYGSTILAVCVTELFILYLQLGDGDILTVSELGEVSRPLPDDQRLFANETTSLCMVDAWRDFRVYFQTLSSSAPALILLSTDGYSNSFKDQNGFLRVGADMLEMIRNSGVEEIRQNLSAWLNEASELGSGDDVTLGMICHMDVSKRTPAHHSRARRRKRVIE